MKEIIFTDYDTVLIENTGIEYTTEEFMNWFEKEIKSGKLTNCSYESDTETIKYKYKNNRYMIDLSNNNKFINPFLVLIELENRLQKDSETDKELLEEAKKGHIKSDYARKLYIDSLKKDLSIVKYLNKLNLFEIISDSFYEQNYFLDILFVFDVLLGILGAIVCLVYGKFGLAIVDVLVTIFQGIMHNNNVLTTRLIFDTIKNTIKRSREISKENKLIKHKIKNLENMNLNEDKDNTYQKEWNDSIDNLISKSINNISAKIVRLNNYDKKIIRNELDEKLREYRDSISKLSNNDIQEILIISSHFMLYLSELNKRIDEMLLTNVDSSQEKNKGKVRVLRQGK